MWDNEPAVGSWRAGRPRLTEEFEGFRATLGIRVVQSRPADPEAKGLVERANGYLETSFLPGRRFASPADFTAQLTSWLVRADERRHGTLGCWPVDRIDADRAAMLSLPPVAPVVGWQRSLRRPATTTSAWTATTTPSTRPRSAVGSTFTPTSSTSPWPAPGGSSRSTRGAGPSTRP